jgi:hypothetical protein
MWKRKNMNVCRFRAYNSLLFLIQLTNNINEPESFRSSRLNRDVCWAWWIHLSNGLRHTHKIRRKFRKNSGSLLKEKETATRRPLHIFFLDLKIIIHTWHTELLMSAAAVKNITTNIGKKNEQIAKVNFMLLQTRWKISQRVFREKFLEIVYIDNSAILMT